MKIRMVDTIAGPNILGNANINDTKAWEIIDLFLTAMNNNQATLQEEKLDNVARELKKYMIRIAKEQLKFQRQLTMESAFNADVSLYD